MPFINPYMEKVKNNPYILTDAGVINKNKGCWNEYFKNQNDIILEIGTGMGNTFSYEIEKDLKSNFIGMEIKYKRLERTCEKALNKGGKNFVLLKEYGEKINDFLEANEITKTIIYFPDPWEKRDHQRRNRIITEKFLNTLAHVTKSGGILAFKTDHIGYFDDVLVILKKVPLWKMMIKTYDYEKDMEIFDKTKITEFEAMYRGENKKICYLELKREN